MPDADPTDLPDLDPRRRRLLFRAWHRGTKEADLIIGGFVARHLRAFTDSDVDALEAVMEYPDVEMTEWLTGRAPIPPECETPMLRRIADEAGRR